MGTRAHACRCKHMQRCTYGSQELACAFIYGGPEYEIQAVKLGSKYLACLAIARAYYNNHHCHHHDHLQTCKYICMLMCVLGHLHMDVQVLFGIWSCWPCLLKQDCRWTFFPTASPN